MTPSSSLPNWWNCFVSAIDLSDSCWPQSWERRLGRTGRAVCPAVHCHDQAVLCQLRTRVNSPASLKLGFSQGRDGAEGQSGLQ